MNHRTTSMFAFSGTVAAALLSSFVVAGTARAEGSQGEATPVQAASTVGRSRAEVQAEVIANRELLSSAGSEWKRQQGEARQPNGYTRAQATAAYIASRDEVAAMNSEHGGGNGFGRAMKIPGPVYAGTAGNTGNASE